MKNGSLTFSCLNNFVIRYLANYLLSIPPPLAVVLLVHDVVWRTEALACKNQIPGNLVS